MKSGELGKAFVFLIFTLSVVVALYAIAQRNLSDKTPDAFPTPTPISAPSGNIIIETPFADSSVTQDFQIKGKARVFEGIVSIRIRDKLTRKVLFQDTTRAYSQDPAIPGDFSYDAHLSSIESLKPNDLLLLEVFQQSPKDGSDIDLVSIQLRFIPALP